MLPVFGFSNDSVVRFFLLFRNYRLVFLWALLKDDASVIGMHRTAFLFIRFIVRFLYRFLFLRFHRLILSCFIFEINFFTYRIHIIIWQSLCLMTSFLVLWLYGLILLCRIHWKMLLCSIFKIGFFSFSIHIIIRVLLCFVTSFLLPCIALLNNIVVLYFQEITFFFQNPYDHNILYSFVFFCHIFLVFVYWHCLWTHDLWFRRTFDFFI